MQTATTIDSAVSSQWARTEIVERYRLDPNTVVERHANGLWYTLKRVAEGRYQVVTVGQDRPVDQPVEKANRSRGGGQRVVHESLEVYE